MMVSICSVEFDPLGSLTIEALPDSDFGDYSRRSNRFKNLDGTTGVNNGPFAHGDRTLNVEFRNTAEIDASLKHIIENHTQVNVSYRDGVFRSLISYQSNIPSVTLQLIEKLSA